MCGNREHLTSIYAFKNKFFSWLQFLNWLRWRINWKLSHSGPSVLLLVTWIKFWSTRVSTVKNPEDSCERSKFKMVLVPHPIFGLMVLRYWSFVSQFYLSPFRPYKIQLWPPEPSYPEWEGIRPGWENSGYFSVLYIFYLWCW